MQNDQSQQISLDVKSAGPFIVTVLLEVVLCTMLFAAILVVRVNFVSFSQVDFSPRNVIARLHCGCIN